MCACALVVLLQLRVCLFGFFKVPNAINYFMIYSMFGEKVSELNCIKVQHYLKLKYVISDLAASFILNFIDEPHNVGEREIEETVGTKLLRITILPYIPTLSCQAHSTQSVVETESCLGWKIFASTSLPAVFDPISLLHSCVPVPSSSSV